jgi:hypothetical protein
MTQKAETVIHWVTLALIVIFAIMSLARFAISPPAQQEPILHGFIGFGIWTLAVGAMWTNPRKWSLRFGLLFCIMLASHTWFWWRARTGPDREKILGPDDTVAGYILEELPLLLAAIGCFWLRFAKRERELPAT